MGVQKDPSLIVRVGVRIS